MNWLPFPIYSIMIDGDKAFIPNDRQLRRHKARYAKIADETKDQMGDPALSEEIKTSLSARLSLELRMYERMEKTCRTLQPKAVIEEYELSIPNFKDFSTAEANATDYIAGVPKVDRSKLMSQLLRGAIRLKGEVLDDLQVSRLHPMEAQAFFEELESRLYIDPDMIPFLLEESQTLQAEAP